MSAVQKVTAVPELLENIVLYLPLRHILLVQSISKKFWDVVRNSPRINRALFFETSTEKTVEWYPPSGSLDEHGGRRQGAWRFSEEGSRVLPYLNPFVNTVNLEPGIGEADKEFKFGLWDSNTAKPYRGVTADYFMTKDVARRFTCDLWSPDLAEFYEQHPNDWRSKARFIDQWDHLLAYSTGSFNRMLLTHPPCRSIAIHGDIRYEPTCSEREQVPTYNEQNRAHIGSFIWAASRISADQRWYSRENEYFDGEDNTVEVEGGESWRLYPKSVDEMSGWEMLRLLETVVESLNLTSSDEL